MLFLFVDHGFGHDLLQLRLHVADGQGLFLYLGGQS